MSVKINEGIANSLQITLPAKGETNWSDKVRVAFQKIGDHDHTGGGNGSQITTEALASQAVTAAKLATDVKLSSLNQVQDTDTPITGHVLTWTGSYWAPSVVSATVAATKVVENQANINALSVLPGDIIAVKNPTGTGYTGTSLIGSSLQLADFSSLTLDGVKIVATDDVHVRIGANKRCALQIDKNLEVVGASESSLFMVQAILLGGTSSLDKCNATIKGDLATNGTGTMSISNSVITCNRININNSNLTIDTTSHITGTTGISSLVYSTGTVSATGDPVEIINNTVRKLLQISAQQLPETSTTNDFLKWTGSAWAGEAILQVPSGGTTNHVLTKTSSGYAWAAIPEKSFVKIKQTGTVQNSSFTVPSGCYALVSILSSSSNHSEDYAGTFIAPAGNTILHSSNAPYFTIGGKVVGGGPSTVTAATFVVFENS
tara:strand:+ start:2384 stop:3685 length:1302 start_codon:yes stop_codon:yes gene_type:complete